ncbi:MAG: zinc-ribbon domain-containing protein [Pseudomonadota bacterium]
MLIDCPGCGAAYHITKAALEPNGRRVACPRCDTVWLAMPATIEAIASDSTLLTDIRISPDDQPPGRAPKHAPRDVPRDVPKHAGYARTVAAPRPPKPRPRMPAFARHVCLGMALLGLAMSLIASRGTVARAWPGAGRLYAAMGMPVARQDLAIRDLHTVMTRFNGVAFLGVEGVIVNPRGDAATVPPVRLAIRDAEGHEIYSWTVTAARSALDSGASLLFRARLAEPPAEGRTVVARFASPDDVIAAR